MISNQILQDTVTGIKSITRVELCVMDTEGKILATTMRGMEEYEDEVVKFSESAADSQVIRGFQFFKVYDENELEYVILAKGDAEDVYMIGKMATFQIQNLLVAYKERFDKDNFIKNLLLDNLLLVDIYNRAKKLHIETDVKRIVFIIETKTEKDTNALETVRTLFSSKTKDFITAVDEKNIILVKEIKPSETYEDMRKTAKVIVDMLNTEAMSSVNVAYGTIVNEIKEVSRSYKEAKLALDVGKIFYSDRKIIAYSNLGIGRLIYQLPLPLCKMFIKEIFDGKSPDEFDEETLTTINKFFENSLNVSETSRQLYIHRNTLVYRLDKLQKSTGEWYVGSEASEARFKEQGIVLDELFQNARSEETVEVHNTRYSYRKLFLMMLKMHVDSFLYRYEGATVKKLVITIPEYNKDLFRVLSTFYKELGVEKEQVEITSHLDSGLYYIFNQDESLRTNSVGLFDYNTDGLHYYRIDISHGHELNTISVTHEDYSENFNLAAFGGDNILMDITFAKIVANETKKTYISAIYLTGLGFSEKWLNKSRELLTQGRRVFAGQNIYTKGACYKAVGGEYGEFYKKYFVETKENVIFDVGISSEDEEDRFIPIALGGRQWYNIHGKISIILDDTESLTLVYRNRKTGEEEREVVKLHGIPKRPNKTSKFSVEVEFENPHHGAFIIKDVGFGKLFPTTNKIYRKEFDV